jgi:hypothetical protein
MLRLSIDYCVERALPKDVDVVILKIASIEGDALKTDIYFTSSSKDVIHGQEVLR